MYDRDLWAMGYPRCAPPGRARARILAGS